MSDPPNTPRQNEAEARDGQIMQCAEALLHAAEFIERTCDDDGEITKDEAYACLDALDDIRQAEISMRALLRLKAYQP